MQEFHQHIFHIFDRVIFCLVVVVGANEHPELLYVQYVQLRAIPVVHCGALLVVNCTKKF